MGLCRRSRYNEISRITELMEKAYKNSVVVGCMKLGQWGAKMTTKEYEKFIDECLEIGLNEFDHADIYGGHTTEAEFGEVIARRPDLKSKVHLTTKCGIAMPSDRRHHKIKYYNSSKEYILKSIDQSLKNLEVDKIDVFLIHRPDFLMDPDEIAEAITEARDAGKVNHFGVSNFSSSQFDLLNSRISLITNQVEVSIAHLNPFQDGTLDQLLKRGIQPSAWSPLAGGILFGRNGDERSIRIRKAAQRLADSKNCQMDQLLLAWIMKHPSGIVPVLGTSKVERLKSALLASNIALSNEEWYHLWTASTGEEVA